MEKNKVAVVTGASKGIGRGIALRLADEGCDIVVNYGRDSDGAEETAREIRARGQKALVVQADVGLKADVERMFNELLESL